MAKRLHRRSSSTPGGSHHHHHHLGCMAGLLHFFDPHQNFHKRKMIHDQRHGEGRCGAVMRARHTRYKTIAFPAGKDHGYTNSTAYFAMEDQNDLDKVASKANLASVIDQETSKEHNQKHRKTPARMTRTFSMHHLKFNDYRLPEVAVDSNGADDTFHLNGIDTPTSEHTRRYLKAASGELLCDKCGEVCGATIQMSNEENNQFNRWNSSFPDKQALLQEKLNEAKAYAKDLKDDYAVSLAKSFLDALELFNTNREIFLKIIQDPNSLSQNYLQDLQNSPVNTAPTKSGSFQGRGQSSGAVSLSKQKHRTETEPFDKQEMQQFQSDLSFSNDGTELNLGHPEPKNYDISLSNLHELKKHKYKIMAPKKFKDVKKRIKDMIKESKNAVLRISMDGILHKLPYGHKTYQYLLGEKSLSKKYGSSGTGNAWSISNGTKYGRPQITKSRSLTESMDRYTSLIESNLGKESKKNGTDRLKLFQQDRALRNKDSPRTRARIHSLPDFDAYFSGRDSQYENLDIISLTRTPSQLNYFSRAPSTDPGEAISDIDIGVSCEFKAVETLANAEEGTEPTNTMEKENEQCAIEDDACSAREVPDECVLDIESHNVEKCDVLNDLADGMITHDNVHNPEARSDLCNGSVQAESSRLKPISNLFLQENLICYPTVSDSEVQSEMENKSNYSEADSLVHPENQSSSDTSGLDEPTSKRFGKESSPEDFASADLHIHVSNKDEEEYNYVWDILNKSGLNESEFLERWYSSDLPIDPSLFEELEAPNCEPDMNACDNNINLDRLLLFDLINEVLLEMYDACFVIHPWLSCFNSQVRSMPMGSHVLEEVWSNISWHLSSQPLPNPTIEYTVSRDFAKNDRWMHVNLETDDISMELEQIIFDDLLDEAMLEFLNGLDHHYNDLFY